MSGPVAKRITWISGLANTWSSGMRKGFDAGQVPSTPNPEYNAEAEAKAIRAAKAKW